MRIFVNGEGMEVPDRLTVEGLLRHLGIRTEYTAVALNREVARKQAYATTALREGDRVEIVRPVGGG